MIQIPISGWITSRTAVGRTLSARRCPTPSASAAATAAYCWNESRTNQEEQAVTALWHSMFSRGKRKRLALALAVCAGLGFLLRGLQGEQPMGLGPLLRETPGSLHPDFRGEWKLDVQASESLVPILRARGKSLMESLVVSRSPVTHVIGGDGNRMTVTVQTPLFTQIQELLLDGTPTDVNDPDGNRITAVSAWSADGQSLITTTNSPSLRMTLTRRLDSDRRTMYLDVSYHSRAGEPIEVRRVFRLVRLVTDPRSA
jgi:hypothetical protein